MDFFSALRERILILDGAMGTMIQRAGLSGGNNELLNITHPDVIEDIHRQYIAAGADIIETNSFGANSIVQKEYGHAQDAASFAKQAAIIARRAADGAARKVWVAGSVGPTGKSLTLSEDPDHPQYREVDFDTMSASYKEQIMALQEGGADLILLETCFDALNTKAAIIALQDCKLPVVISATVSDRSGRTLTGQTLESFYVSIQHAPRLAAFGINCALGADAMAGFVRDIATLSQHPIIFYPNAGVPDALGNYMDSPEQIANVMRNLAQQGQLNIAGGCCGTTPDHIRAIAAAVKGLQPAVKEPSDGPLRVCGLETVTIDRTQNFTNIGERTNVAGSKKFARLIEAENYDAALEVAHLQVEGGATVIDVNMDDPMLDSAGRMRDFLRYAGADPAVAKAAVMIDSSDWKTIIAGLQNAQGKCIVNSISLKDGEATFIAKAREIISYGAAMVVMAFDEQGQAVTYQRKIDICKRSYGLLTAAGIPANHIIFDCNILTIGTGIPEHARYAVDFIESVRWIKENLPGALTSGGVSNLSFAFRGNNPVRESMHSVFLYHAIRAGLDMAIVNPQMLQIYIDIPQNLRDCLEDVILDRSPRATECLIKLASCGNVAQAQPTEAAPDPCLAGTAESRLRDAVIRGDSTHIKEDSLECLQQKGDAVEVIEGPLMEGMEKVGELFSAGKMFLPQVVKSAKIMREAMDALRPYMKETHGSGRRPVFVIATVQGDVHDIGKKITGSVLMCSGFEVHDLGVMVPCNEILSKAQELKADIIGVSGLISPSLVRMEELCREMKSRGLKTPLFVGGAATSALHLAVKLSPLYDYVFYGANASETAVKAKKYMQDPSAFIQEEQVAYSRLRSLRNGVQRPKCTCCQSLPCITPHMDLKDIPLKTMGSAELMPYYDWKMFSAVCGVKDLALVKDEALSMLQGMTATVCAIFRDEGQSQMGYFAVRADLGGCPPDDLIAHAACVTLAEAGSTYLASAITAMLPAGRKAFLPAPGYPMCPDHSLKKLILDKLPSAMGITLTESYAMIPEASICGFVCLK